MILFDVNDAANTAVARGNITYTENRPIEWVHVLLNCVDTVTYDVNCAVLPIDQDVGPGTLLTMSCTVNDTADLSVVEPGTLFAYERDTTHWMGGIRAFYFGARYYDPELGIWGSTDPKKQLFNPYGYASNPVMFIDPNGEYIIGGILGALAGAYFKGVMANITADNPLNPGEWNWDDPGTIMGVIGGAMSGASLGSSIENAAFKSYFKSTGNSPKTDYGLKVLNKLARAEIAAKPNIIIPEMDLTDAYILNRHNAVFIAGHQAIVVGNDETGYYYFSKDAKVGLGSNTALDFDSFNDFLGATDLHTGLPFRDSYSSAYRIITTPEQDMRMLDYAFENYQKPYDLFRNNCSDLAGSVLNAEGIIGYTNGWTWPNIQYNNIQFNYPGMRITF